MISHIENIVKGIDLQDKDDFLNGNLGSKNQFFRDIVNEKYHDEVKKLEIDLFEPLMLAFDKSITPVENEMMEFDFKELVYDAMEILNGQYDELSGAPSGDVSIHFDAELNLLKGNYHKITDTFKEHIDSVADQDIHISNMVGTGYGRALLPFPEECMK